MQKGIAFLMMVMALASHGCGKAGSAVDAIALLSGTWTTGCSLYAGNTYIKITNTFSGATMSGSTRYYNNDAACGDSTEMLRQDTVSTITDGSASSAVSGAYNYNFTWSTLTMTIKMDGGLVDQYNSEALCGITNWALNISQDIARKTCDNGGTPTLMPSAGSVKYDIIKVSATSLQFGKITSEKNGTTTGTRPNELETTTYTKI